MTEQKVTTPEWPRVFLRQIFVFCFPFNFKTVVCVQQTHMFHSLIYPSIRPSARLSVHPFLAPVPFTSIEATSIFPSICPLNMRVIFPVMKVRLKNLIDYYTSTSVIMVKLKRRTSWILFFFGQWISFYNNSETYLVHTNLYYLERNKFRSLSSYSHPQSEHHKVWECHSGSKTKNKFSVIHRDKSY